MSITDLASGLWGTLLTPIAFLFVLTVVVFIHEMGHFVVARWCGVAVKAFSIGFGKEIYAFVDRHGTRWRLAWIPLGGYVKFMGDENAASAPSREAINQMSEAERAGSFHLKPLWQRAAVVAAGPIANFLLAMVIFTGLFMANGITKLEPRISKVVPDTPAAAAGFQAGDVILSIDDRQIDDFAALQDIVNSNPGQSLKFEVDRSGTIKTLIATPELRELDDPIAGKISRPVIGIQGSGRDGKVTHRSVPAGEAVFLGVERTWTIGVRTLQYLGQVFTGHQKADQIGGPARIADIAGKLAHRRLDALIPLIAVISVTIGLINLFPVPLLDGGHLLFYAIEAVRGKPLSEGVQEFSFRIGLALILMLMIFAFYNDRGIIAGWFS